MIYIAFGGIRKIVVLRHADGTLLPAGEFLIPRFNLLQHRRITRHLTQDVPFIAVPSTQGEAGQRVKPIACGLWRSDRLQSEVVSIPYPILIWGALLLLSAFALLWPLLKVHYMSASERLRRKHVFYLLFSTLFVTSLLTVAAVVLTYAVIELLHVADPAKHGPAGGVANLGHGAFLFDDSRLALAIHEAVPAMMQLAGAAIVLLLAYDLYRRRPAADAVRQAVFLAACFIVGPGLVANTLLKDNWGRPRPSQIAAFGGPDRFAPPLLIGNQCPHNCSFVAGDGAAIFTFLAFALLLPAGRSRRIGVAVVAVLGAVMGIIRMGQGAHFLSDVVFAGLFMALVVLLLQRLLMAPQKISPAVSIRPAPPRL